jgi:uncharacterized repeat protein (TIGR01451 family)
MNSNSYSFKCFAMTLGFVLMGGQLHADNAALDLIDTNTPLPPERLQINTVQRALALRALPAGGLLLVTDSTNDRVMALSPTNGALITDNFIVDAARLETPINAILSPDGREVLVSDQVSDIVNAYDVDTGAFVRTVAPAGGANTAILDNIRGIGLAPNQDLLVTVAAGGNINAIARFALATGLQGTPFVASNQITTIASPYDIFRIPQSAGALIAGQYLISSADNGKVTRVSDAGVLIGEFATAGTFAQQIAQARNGNILVGGFGVNADGVFEFSPSGLQIARLDDPTIGGYRGVYELPNGNVLTSTGSGVYELNRSTGVIVNNQVSGVQARYIEFVQAPGADLAISKTSNAQQVAQNASVEFTLTARNLSTVTDASSVLVTDVLPNGLSYQGNSCAAGFANNTLSWNIPNLVRNSSQTCTLTVRVTAAGNLVNIASITGAGIDPVTSNNSATAGINSNVIAAPIANRLGLSILAGLITLIGALWVGARRV